MTQKKEPNEEKKKSSLDKAAKSAESKAQQTVDNLYKFTKDIPAEAIAYVVLALGLILLPFYSLWGGTLVGVIFGVYFCATIVAGIRSLREFLETAGRTKSIVLGGTILAALIVLPTFFLGAAAAIGIVSLLQMSKGGKK